MGSSDESVDRCNRRLCYLYVAKKVVPLMQGFKQAFNPCYTRKEQLFNMFKIWLPWYCVWPFKARARSSPCTKKQDNN